MNKEQLLAGDGIVEKGRHDLFSHVSEILSMNHLYSRHEETKFELETECL